MSVRRTRTSGQRPAADRVTVVTALTIRAVVSGIASRFVSRKYCGKVPK